MADIDISGVSESLSLASVITSSVGIPDRTWWDPTGIGLRVWAAYRPHGADSLAHSYKDLSGQDHDASEGTAPAWTSATGWTFDGSDDYLDSGFVPGNDQNQTVIIQFSGVTNNGWICGADGGAGDQFGIVPDNGSSKVAYYNGGTQTSTGAELTEGNLGVADNDGYRAGADDSGDIAAWSTSTALTMYIGAANNGSDTGHCACTILSMAIYDEALTPAQISNIASAMQADSESDVFISVWDTTQWSSMDVLTTDTVNALCVGAQDGYIPSKYDMYIGVNAAGTAQVAGSVTATNNGSGRAWPVLRISRDGPGDATIIALQNETTGEWVAFNYALMDGEELEIDFRSRWMTSSFAGDVQSRMVAGDLFALQPGSNTITLFVKEDDYPTITAYLTWRDTYSSAD